MGTVVGLSKNRRCQVHKTRLYDELGTLSQIKMQPGTCLLINVFMQDQCLARAGMENLNVEFFDPHKGGPEIGKLAPMWFQVFWGV